MCENFQILINTVIIVTSFVWFQPCLFVIATVIGDCTILILRKLWFGVCHCCCCLLIYDCFVILLCFILNFHRTFLSSQVLNLFIFGIFEHNLFASDKAIHNLQFWIINNKFIKQVSVIRPSDHWSAIDSWTWMWCIQYCDCWSYF